MRYRDATVITLGMTVYMGVGAFAGLVLYNKIVEKITGQGIIVVTK